MTVIALIVAAGRGHRLAGDRPKQYRPLGAMPLLSHSLRSFRAHPAVDDLCVVIHPDDMAYFEDAARDLSLASPVLGGARRQDSVLRGLLHIRDHVLDRAVDPASVRVLVHDAARPFVPPSLVDRVIAALDDTPAAVPALALADTLKRGADGLVTETVPRAGLYRVQTPQGFHFQPLIAAHERFGETEVTDDAALMERAGHDVALVTGDERAFKVTTEADLVQAENMLGQSRETRVGTGIDVHRFAAGNHVTLCGIAIPHKQGLKGHSDADVGIHAIVDAILGALAEGDIGQHFPPSDPRWKDAPSTLFLEDAARRVRLRRGRIIHVDLTLLCEAPKIGPHRAAMAASVANILGIAGERVSIKATTTEGLGFTGRREGIAAQATVTLDLPGGSWEDIPCG